jgi:hypothetical protein
MKKDSRIIITIFTNCPIVIEGEGGPSDFTQTSAPVLRRFDSSI